MEQSLIDLILPSIRCTLYKKGNNVLSNFNMQNRDGDRVICQLQDRNGLIKPLSSDLIEFYDRKTIQLYHLMRKLDQYNLNNKVYTGSIRMPSEYGTSNKELLGFSFLVYNTSIECLELFVITLDNKVYSLELNKSDYVLSELQRKTNTVGWFKTEDIAVTDISESFNEPGNTISIALGKGKGEGNKCHCVFCDNQAKRQPDRTVYNKYCSNFCKFTDNLMEIHKRTTNSSTIDVIDGLPVALLCRLSHNTTDNEFRSFFSQEETHKQKELRIVK